MKSLNLWFSDGKCFETVPYIEHDGEDYIKRSDVVKMLNQVEQWPPNRWGISFPTLSAQQGVEAENLPSDPNVVGSSDEMT
jgi:hypothetical protein